MATKTTPISVRITPRDAEFMAELKIDEAVTPSDKIRALLKEAREKRDTAKDLSTCLGVARKAVGPVLNRLKQEEMKQQVHSEVVSTFGEWLVEILGYMASLEGKEQSQLDLVTIEGEIASRLFRLFSTMLRMGITKNAPCYNPGLIENSLPSLIELINIIQERMNKEECNENKNC